MGFPSAVVDSESDSEEEEGTGRWEGEEEEEWKGGCRNKSKERRIKFRGK